MSSCEVYDYIFGDGDDNDNDKYTLTHINEDLIAGKWSTTLEIDSIVLVFEKRTMKKYAYEKSTGMLLDRLDYGTYWLYEVDYGKGETPIWRIEVVNRMDTMSYYKKFNCYLDSTDTELDIRLDAGANFVTYLRIK